MYLARSRASERSARNAPKAHSMMLRAQRAAALLRTFDGADHDSQHAFIRDDKSAKSLFNIAN